MAKRHVKKAGNDIPTLRQRAEAKYANRPQDAILIDKEQTSLLHELQVHQIELEIQNDELRASHSLIEESRRRFVELYEFAPVGYCTLDTAGTIRHANLTLISFLAYTRRYVLGKPLSTFVHREDKDTIFQFLRKLRQTSGQQRCELRLKKKGGQIIFTELISVPITNHDNAPTQFLVAVLEISARKQAEEELRIRRDLIERNNEFLNSVLNGITDAFLSVDNSGRLSFLNHNAEILFKRNSSAVLGRYFHIAFPESKQIKLNKQQLRALRDNKPVVFEYFYPLEPLRDWYEIRLYPFSEGICVFVVVITQRKHIQEALEEHTRQLDFANREMESFSYSVSHDLNAPLRAMKGFSDVLLEDYTHQIDDQGQEFLQKIADSAIRMQRLINDILSLSRVSRQDVHFQETDLSVIARKVLHDLQSSQPERIVDVKIVENLKAIADPHLMQIALANLLGNAWKYTGKTANPYIEFGSFRKDSDTVFFVKDNGVGYDPKYAEKLFLPFQRLHAEAQFSGTGVGLSIVARIISRHKGRIWAEGEKDKGAVFYFVLGTGSKIIDKDKHT